MTFHTANAFDVVCQLDRNDTLDDVPQNKKQKVATDLLLGKLHKQDFAVLLACRASKALGPIGRYGTNRKAARRYQQCQATVAQSTQSTQEQNTCSHTLPHVLQAGEMPQGWDGREGSCFNIDSSVLGCTRTS